MTEARGLAGLQPMVSGRIRRLVRQGATPATRAVREPVTLQRRLAMIAVMMLAAVALPPLFAALFVLVGLLTLGAIGGALALGLALAAGLLGP